MMAMSKKSQLPPIAGVDKMEDSSSAAGSKTPLSPREISRAAATETKKAEGLTSSTCSRSSPISSENAATPRKSRPRSWTLHLLSQLFSLLWLAPIITLLVLNFKGYVIGASVWCPFGRCPSDAFNSNAIATAVKLDHTDHDVLAGLQFVAQAFEIWFVVIATALLYNVGMIFARSPGGLPVGYMMTHLEFSDAHILFNQHLWTSAFAPRNPTLMERKRRSVTLLFLFAVLAVLLTIISNLMGAASAVLLIPSLTWVKTDKVPQQRFEGIALAQGPHGNAVFPNSCNDTQLLAGNYSCTAKVYGPSLDEWAASAQASIRQFEQPNGMAVLATSQEAAVQFALNASSDMELIWVANRQVLRDVSGDYLNAVGKSHEYLRAIGETDGGSADPRFERSLQTVLQRTGPSVGVQGNCFAGNVSVTRVANDKEIHCFDQWSLDGVHNYTKCFRIGQGFNPINTQSRFWLGGMDPSENQPLTAIDTSFSDLATFYNSTDDFGSGIQHCVSNDTAPTCHWDKIFSTPLPVDLQNNSINTGLISYSLPSPPTPQARIYCDSIIYLSFPTYSLDTSISSNELRLVQLDQLAETQNHNPLIVSPDWLLAAYSVDRNGTVDGNRLLARELRRVLQLYWNDQSELNTLQMFIYHIYSLGQAMSMVDFNSSVPFAPSGQSAEAEQGMDAEHPVLMTWAQLHVWAWGLSARTSKLGVVIAVCGCVSVFVKLGLGTFMARRQYSPVELFGAALGYREGGEEHREGESFEGMSEREMARCRLRIVDEHGDGGGLKFVKSGRVDVSREGG